MIHNLEHFIQLSRGKKYKITAKQLLRRSIHKTLSCTTAKQAKYRKMAQTEPGEEPHFFCSELIASAYKAMGLLNSNIPSYEYWPGDFAAGKNLSIKGGNLSEELQILFDTNL